MSAQHSPASKPIPTARPPTRLLLVSNDPALADIASTAAANLHASLDVMPTLDAAIAWLLDRKSTRLNSSHLTASRMPSSA